MFEDLTNDSIPNCKFSSEGDTIGAGTVCPNRNSELRIEHWSDPRPESQDQYLIPILIRRSERRRLHDCERF
jgi:hypothetical protein